MDSEKILSEILQNEFDIEMMKELFFHAGETDEVINQSEKNMRLYLDTEIERKILGGKESIHLLEKR